MPWRICLLGVIAATLAGSARADDRWWPTTGFGDGAIRSLPHSIVVRAYDARNNFVHVLVPGAR